MLLAIFSVLLLGYFPLDNSAIEDYINSCAEERKIIVLDHDIQIDKDVTFYKVMGNGHTINVSEGVTIRTTDECLFLEDLTFVINEYGNKFGFPLNRGQLIQSRAKNVILKKIIVKTAKEGDSLKYDETSGWRGRSFLLINNAEKIKISNITSYNIGTLITYNNSHNAKVNNVVAYNCETNQYIKPTCSHFYLSDIEIKNSKKDKLWVIGGMSGKGTNGKDVVLSGAWNCRFNRISGENCIEKVIYSRGGGNIKASNLRAINCGGFKFVGHNPKETSWVRNIKIKKCKWIKTDSEIYRVKILKTNLSSDSNLTVSASNLGVFQINKVDGIMYDDVYLEDRTGENCASISNVHSCRNILLSNWIIHNVHCSRPVIYITGCMPEKAFIEIKNMTLHNYAPSNRIGESVLVGYRTGVPIEGSVYVMGKDVSIMNNDGYLSKELIGEGINSQSLSRISVNGGLDVQCLDK